MNAVPPGTSAITAARSDSARKYVDVDSFQNSHNNAASFGHNLKVSA